MRHGGGVCSPCLRANYLWELWTGLYMLDPSEKVTFNLVLVVLIALGVRYVAPVLPLPALPLPGLSALSALATRLLGGGGD